MPIFDGVVFDSNVFDAEEGELTRTVADSIASLSDSTTRSVVLTRTIGDSVSSISDSVLGEKFTPTTARSFAVVIT